MSIIIIINNNNTFYKQIFILIHSIVLSYDVSLRLKMFIRCHTHKLTI